MITILCLFVAISFFEVFRLIKLKEKKEAAVFICTAALAIFLAMYLILSPQYDSFSVILFNLFNIDH